MTRPKANDARERVPLAQKAPLLVALVLLWMMLWGSVTLLTIVTGILVAIIVTSYLYLPPVALSGRFHLGWAIVLALRFFFDLFVASFQVAWFSFRPRGVGRSAVVRVQLNTRSDLIMTATGLSISLVPGSVVLEVDRPHAVLYVHSLGVDTAEGVERARANVYAYERRFLRAIGSRAEWEAVR
jgi:multicomponent Na+:H+ antiporter subunit E